MILKKDKEGFCAHPFSCKISYIYYINKQFYMLREIGETGNKVFFKCEENMKKENNCFI